MRRSVGCMLTLGRNYSSPARSSPGLGRYLRVPAFQRGRERNYSAVLRERQKKSSSSSSIQGEYTAVWLQSLWIKKSRSVSTSGLRRDGLSSCCCCQRLVQKEEKVMEGRYGQERHKHKEVHATHYSVKARKCRSLLCLSLSLYYKVWRSKVKTKQGKRGKTLTKQLGN